MLEEAQQRLDTAQEDFDAAFDELQTEMKNAFDSHGKALGPVDRKTELVASRFDDLTVSINASREQAKLLTFAQPAREAPQ